MKKKLLLLILALTGSIGMCEAEETLRQGQFRLTEVRINNEPAFTVPFEDEQYKIAGINADTEEIAGMVQIWIDSQLRYEYNRVSFYVHDDSIVSNRSDIKGGGVFIDNFDVDKAVCGGILGSFKTIRMNPLADTTLYGHKVSKNAVIEETWEAVRPSNEGRLIFKLLLTIIVDQENTKRDKLPITNIDRELKKQFWEYKGQVVSDGKGGEKILSPTESWFKYYGEDYCIMFQDPEKTWHGSIKSVEYNKGEWNGDVTIEDGNPCIIQWTAPDTYRLTYTRDTGTAITEVWERLEPEL